MLRHEIVKAPRKGAFIVGVHVVYVYEEQKRRGENLSFRVPDGTRTHDIQNHNLTL